MAKTSASPTIRLRGVRHNNLKNFDLDLPQNRLIVVTGLSGSGKSSLAFDTLFAEGQRRYIETFSPYARQFFDRMDKPQVDSIEGIPPAIAIEQRNSVKSTRSTVGTMTEICDYMKLVWPQIAQLHCRQCGRPVRKDSPQQIWQTISASASSLDAAREALITFSVPISEKLSLDESLALIAKQGYQRLLLDGEILRLEDATPRLRELKPASLAIVQDRLKLAAGSRPRFVEACEQAFHFGKGKLAIYALPSGNPKSEILIPQLFSNRLHCAECDIDYREPSAALFSFNHPVGACPACRGFGRIITIDYNLALPDRSKTLAGGVVKPWQSGQSAECQQDLMKFCRIRKAPANVPFRDLPQKWQDWLINGDPDYGKDAAHKWPRAWYGIKGYFRWLESKSYKMHVRVLLSRYRSYSTCPSCLGRRFQPEALLYKVPKPGDVGDESSGITLSDFYLLPVRDARSFIEKLAAQRKLNRSDPLALALDEVRSRLGYLNDVGLGYLTLDRPTRSLSGGETERVNLTTCLGTRLVNTLFVLDEPSVGLHPRDTGRLVKILEQLRNAGNTVVVVEHEASVMRAADQIIDLGPGHGAAGGGIVFQGPYSEILESPVSLTGQYLAGARRVEIPERRQIRLTDKPPSPVLKLAHATLHNLNDLSVGIPLGRFVCLTGVSGSGKTTLARDILLPLLTSRLQSDGVEVSAADISSPENGTVSPAEDPEKSAIQNPQSAILSGSEHLGRVVLVDQATLGKTPRSNPAVYIGAFDDIRELFAQSDLARRQGLNASAFSFNSAQGQCERCRGAGFEKIEMQFLSDIFVRCPECNGRRYRPHILEIGIKPESAPAGAPSARGTAPTADQSSDAAAAGSSPSPPRSGGEGRGEVVRSIKSVPAASAMRKALLSTTSMAVGSGRGFSLSSNSAESETALGMSIGDMLDATVDEAVAFLSDFADSRHARRAVQALDLLQQVGLGYLRLGQPINTLSGGESQRLKLVRHLADFAQAADTDTKPTLFLFDEPTTGLHFDDVRVLLQVFQRLVANGHSVVIIEHNLDVIKSADWVIDLGPDAGDQGGRIVAQGTPEDIAACNDSHTGRALKEVLTDPTPLRRSRKRARVLAAAA